nr:ribonuclease H-like domain, reverse transcriptase, RNA-dependent DNA polymerase [Tanacetum cinerariifolium]
MTDHQLEKNMPIVQHAYVDHYLNGLYAGYAPHPMIQPHMVHIAPARVPLPLDLSKDSPIYVNAKQYNGILRRRQIRAKLEAQNKLVKNRKHAVNRVRGLGGRFLPSNKSQQSKHPTSRFLSSHCTAASDHVMFSQMEHGFSSISWGTRGNEGFLDHNRSSIGRESSYGINTDQGKGTTGIVFYFGESPITWCTQKQPTVTLSSCESEFMVATGAACQALWLKRVLSELTGWEEKRITLKVDNVSAMALVRNPVFHGKNKHIDIRYHFIRECVENGHINVEHISGELQRADVLTKALPRLKFVTMRQMLRVQDLGRSNDQD